MFKITCTHTTEINIGIWVNLSCARLCFLHLLLVVVFRVNGITVLVNKGLVATDDSSTLARDLDNLYLYIQRCRVSMLKSQGIRRFNRSPHFLAK